MVLFSFHESARRVEAERIKQRTFVRYFDDGHSANQMRTHVMRFRRRGIVHIAANIQIKIIGITGDLGTRYDACVAGNVLVVVEGGYDFFDVLWTKVVLCAASVELGVSIDEENLAATLRGLVRVRRLAGEIRVHHEDAGRDARAVEQVLRQANDGFDEVLF